jgi:hypothetical protein
MSGAVRGIARRLKGSRPKDPKESPDEAFKKLVAERQRQQLLGPPEPPPCPPGWQVGPPTFIGVGTQKSGTQWWSHQLFVHPDSVRPVRKELHYFQHGWDTVFSEEAASRYHLYFPRRPGLVTGEWTPRYMVDPWTPPRIRAAAPEAKILVLLRDPMERLRSGLRHNLVRFGPLHPHYVIESIERGRYASQLRRLLEYMPREQVLVLQLERCSEEPERELARTYEFLGLASDFVPEDLHRPRGVAWTAPLALTGELWDTALEIYTEEMKMLADDWPELDLSLWPTTSVHTT